MIKINLKSVALEQSTVNDLNLSVVATLFNVGELLVSNYIAISINN